MSEALDVRLAAAAKRPVHEAIAAFARHLAEETGALAALFYGSNLRTGTLEGVIDYYLLTEGMPESGLWPCVSYREWEHGGQKLRAKIATMTLAKFAQACQGATLDTTIWARFVQPCAVVFARDSSVEGKVLAALAHAAQTAARLAVAIGPASGAESDFWRALFRATYRAELRVEQPGRENAIVEANPEHFSGLLPIALAAQGIAFGNASGGAIAPCLAPARRRAILRWWAVRQGLGKFLNIARLVRATATFDGAARYAAWKVERHTGIKVNLSAWNERHPLLSAPGLAWQVWRKQKERS